MPHKQREIIESERFSAADKKLKGGLQRLDEALCGAVWAVSANPEWGREVPGTSLRVFPVVVPEGEILIYYRCSDSDQIIFEDLMVTPRER